MGTTGLLVGTDGTLAAVTVAQANGSHLASMYAHIGCRTVDVISVSTNAGTLDVWVDDEGAFTAAQNVIEIRRPPQPIYQTVIEKTRGLAFRTQALGAAMARTAPPPSTAAADEQPAVVEGAR